jgi:DNA polymerase-4/DNA polymerase V
VIAHIDADSFFASVLVRLHPNLRGKPLLAIGMGGNFVIAATYEAKAFGVKTGMRLSDARKLVPNVIEMPSDFRETGIASKQIEDILKNHCPVMEQMSIDEWYLDLGSLMGGVPKDCTAWAREIQKTVTDQTAISVSVGVGPSKLLAKMAGEYKKPAGVTVLGIQDIETFLRDRPAAAIPGIGRSRMVHAESQGWKTAWDIAAADPIIIKKLFGKSGTDIQQELAGDQTSPVCEDTRPPQSISRCRSFRPTKDLHVIKGHALKHAEYCIQKMRRHDLFCTHVSMWVRNRDYRFCSNHMRLPKPSNTEQDIMPTILNSLMHIQKNGPWNQVGLALHGLVPSGAAQPSLFDDPTTLVMNEKLQSALDALHTRYGRNSITRGAALNVSTGTHVDFNLPVVD